MDNKIVHAAPVPPFVTFVASAVPMVFDNSMSYYEALCALWKWLQDDVINVINNNASVTEEYIQLTKDMKEYMDNYFDNLDVQEEINNKLDAMVEAGTLQEIITTYIQSNVAWTFDTVADMKLATNLVDGSYARTLGFHSVNDGGGATYYITDSGSADEMQVIAIGDLYANLVLPVVVNPEIFGAYGDGINGDSSAIQKAVDSGKPVRLTKNYLLNSTIYIGNQDTSGTYKSNVVFDGDGATFTYHGTSSAFMLAGMNGATIKLGKIEADAGNCIELWSTNGNVRLAYVDIYFKELRPSKKAFYVHTSATGFINEISYNGGVIYTGEHGFYIESNPSELQYHPTAHRFNNICFEGCDTCYYMNAITQQMRGFTFTNDRFVENITSTLFECHGVMREFRMKTWSTLFEERLNFTNATLWYCKFECPVFNSITNKYLGSGIFYNQSTKKYLFDSYSTKTLTKNDGVTGNVLIIHDGNQYILSLLDVGINTANKTLVAAANNPLPPARRFVGTATDNAGHSARVEISADGKIQLTTSSDYVGNTFDGAIPFVSFTPENL